jgi:hypothetical protein
MGTSAQRLIFRGNVATINPGQVVNITAATHGLTIGNGTALIPNYVDAGPLRATINTVTGDVLLQNAGNATITNQRVVVGYVHSYIGAIENPLGNATYTALAAADPAGTQSGGATGSIVAVLNDGAVALANGAVPWDSLATTWAGATYAAGVFSLPVGTYVANWNITATSSGTGLVTFALSNTTGGVLGGSMSKTFTTGEEHIFSGSGVLGIGVQSNVQLTCTLGAGAAGTYASAGTAAAAILGMIHIQKIA